MEIKNALVIITIFGFVFFSSFSLSYAADSLESSTINSGAINSTSSGFRLLSEIGQIGGYITSSGFQLFAGFLPTTQGGNAIPAGLFSGTSCQTASDGSVSCPSLGPNTVATMDFSEMYAINTVNNEDQITTDRDFAFSGIGLLGAAVLLPSGTTITADTNTWDGNSIIPRDLGTTVIASGGSETTLAIRMGQTGIDFSLNKPVRITFPGKIGQNVEIIDKSGNVIPVTIQCNGIDLTTVNAQLATDEACKINNNLDLIVWTKRLSTFVASANKPGGGFMDVEGPSFTQDFSGGEVPLVIGNTAFPTLGYYNVKTDTATLNIGTAVPFRLLMSENVGPQNVQHVALYMNLYGFSGTESHKSDTWIVFEKNRDIEIHDPHGFIDDAYASTATNGNKFETSFYITFAKPMQRSNLIIVAWDSSRNGVTSAVLDAFEVIDPQAEAKKQQKEAVTAEALQMVQEKEAVVVEALQMVQEKELVVVAAIAKYGAASTEAKLAQDALDKAENEAKVAQDALDIAKSALDEVTKETIPAQTQEPAVPTPEPGVDVVPEPGVDVASPAQKETIQKWAGFHVASASDSDLLSALNIETESDTAPKLPKWTKNTLAKWVLDEKISMKEFVNAVKYFVKK